MNHLEVPIKAIECYPKPNNVRLFEPDLTEHIDSIETGLNAVLNRDKTYESLSNYLNRVSGIRRFTYVKLYRLFLLKKSNPMNITRHVKLELKKDLCLVISLYKVEFIAVSPNNVVEILNIDCCWDYQRFYSRRSEKIVNWIFNDLYLGYYSADHSKACHSYFEYFRTMIPLSGSYMPELFLESDKSSFEFTKIQGDYYSKTVRPANYLYQGQLLQPSQYGCFIDLNLYDWYKRANRKPKFILDIRRTILKHLFYVTSLSDPMILVSMRLDNFDCFISSSKKLVYKIYPELQSDLISLLKRYKMVSHHPIRLNLRLDISNQSPIQMVKAFGDLINA